MDYFCCDEHRRNDVKDHAFLNGIDFLEVLDNPGDPLSQRQTTLYIHFVKALVPGTLTKENVLIQGGERIKDITVTDVKYGIELMSPLSPEQSKILVITVSQAGDFSTYTLRLVRGLKDESPPDGFDLLLSAVDFSFKILCANDFDCKPPHSCEKELVEVPDINYLAKDYASFRQLMLDRMALLMPRRRERNPADLGIVLVELLAYVGDYLSYQQDAIATEAYLGTARKRVSIRRHARLVDYYMHDGSNSRVWAQVRVKPDADGILLQKEYGGTPTKFLTGVKDLPAVFSVNVPEAPDLNSPEYDKSIIEDALFYELMYDVNLFYKHNDIKFYTWGSKECCLPKGTTQATLAAHLPGLKPGDVLILTEVLGPQTGAPEDANPLHRHPVRLTEVTFLEDTLYDQVLDSPLSASPPAGSSMVVTKIKWHPADALPFSLCISSRNDTEYYTDVSIALGNIVLADYGRSIEDKVESSLDPDTVAIPELAYAPSAKEPCEQVQVMPVPSRFRPKLKRGPLTQAVFYDLKKPPASAAVVMQWSMRDPAPSIVLNEYSENELSDETKRWLPVRDLLNSNADAKEFVVEVESDGIAWIRFGNDVQGIHPAANTKFIATYRIGNGVISNTGANTLAHIVSNDPLILGNRANLTVWNPLPAKGGCEAEPIEQVKQKAPDAFRRQERAVTPDDYEEVSKRCDASIQRSACIFRWTGSWHTAFLTVDRYAAKEVDAAFETDLRNCMEKYRMAGYDLEVDSPRYVSLEIEMSVCIKPHYFAGDVKAALMNLFSNRVLPDGSRGVFHPDNFTFGQTVYLSPLYAAAQSVEGVDFVQITKFTRQNEASTEAIDSGRLLLNKLEIARLDNDPNFPEHGLFNLI